MLERWDIVLVIIALVGLIAAIVGPVVKLTKAITKLTVSVDTQEKTLRELTVDNRASHQRLWTHNTEQDATLNDHETRIHTLERFDTKRPSA